MKKRSKAERAKLAARILESIEKDKEGKPLQRLKNHVFEAGIILRDCFCTKDFQLAGEIMEKVTDYEAVLLKCAGSFVWGLKQNDENLFISYQEQAFYLGLFQIFKHMADKKFYYVWAKAKNKTKAQEKYDLHMLQCRNVISNAMIHK